MGLGLGTRLGEYKDPETQLPRLRRARSEASSRWNGYAVDLDGSDEFFRRMGNGAPKFGTSNGGDKFQMQCIIKPHAVSEHRVILCQNQKATTTPEKTATIYQKDSYLYAACTEDGWSGNEVGVKGNSTISNDTWYHISVEFTLGDTPAVAMYVNDVKQAASYDNSAVYYLETGSGVSIVGVANRDESGSITATYWNGVINQVAIWTDGHLNKPQRKGIYFGGKPRSPFSTATGTGSLEDLGVLALQRYWPVQKNDYSDNYVRHMRKFRYEAGANKWKWGSGFDTSVNDGNTDNGYGMISINEETGDIVNEYMGD